MLKYAILLAVVCIVFRWVLGKWPWQLLGSPPTRAQAIFEARKLLGVEEGASREQIKLAHKRLISMVHPDRGGTSAAVHEANDARDLLLAELPHPGARNSVGQNDRADDPDDTSV